MAKTRLNEREKAAQNAYMRKWRKKNPDKVKQYRKTYFSRLADRMENEAREAQDSTAAANE